MIDWEMAEELKKAGEMYERWLAIMIMAAESRKQVVIKYKHLDDSDVSVRPIEPVNWERGRKGIHVLAYSPKDESFRRFAVKNILSVTLTTEDYVSSLETNI